jgi:hypothetical protein
MVLKRRRLLLPKPQALSALPVLARAQAPAQGQVELPVRCAGLTVAAQHSAQPEKKTAKKAARPTGQRDQNAARLHPALPLTVGP